MKKNVFAVIIMCTLLLCACGDKKQDSEISENVSTSADSSVEHQPQNEPTDKAILNQTTATETPEKVTESQTETTTVNNINTEVTESTESVFEVDENGAVIMEAGDNTDESVLLLAGQTLYEQACVTEFRFHVGCPYSIDYNVQVENQYGWPYYLVTESGYDSIADVENDYYKVFAEEYGNDLSELYIEQDGKLYALDGARGSNIFYDSSKVVSIVEQSDSEIVFEVENYYTGNDLSPDTPTTETERFSVVIKDGEWRVGDFYLPY